MLGVRRLFLIALLLISLASQGMADAAQRALVGHGDQEHVALHLGELAHHHNDGAADSGDSVVVDNSGESIAHVATDGALGGHAVPHAIAWASLPPVSYSPPHWGPDSLPSPDLAGLRRPPRPIL